MRAPTFAVIIGLVCLPALAGAMQHQHESGSAAAARVGNVHFATSCVSAVEKDFDHAVALLHSFWFSAAIDAFNDVLQKDPSCAMAHWGIAMSWWGNPFGGFRSPKALQEGAAAAEKAGATGARTDRERGYIAAVALLYRDAATSDQRTRTVAYERAMERLAATQPADPEARIFYALALDQTALPTDKTYANQLKAAGILEQEFARQPDHPGIAHYLIHSYDAPALAPRALAAARRYANIAPDAPHALHMPSHTFTRLGYWQESIDANLASMAAARKDGNAASEELHAMDYAAYAYLQTAQDAAAKKIVDGLAPIAARIKLNAAGVAAPATAGQFAFAAIPARYALERGDWAAAAALDPVDAGPPWTRAITFFARALGSARLGRADDAAKDLAALESLGDTLKKTNDTYWAGQVDIQRRVAAAWIAFAQGRKDEAIAAMREAAGLEDGTDKSAISPGPLKPVRELLGEMLLEAGRPADALAEFEKTMKKEPNRFRSVYGAARAAAGAGDRARARTLYAMLLNICERADTPRPELIEARKVAGR
jgi:hypothetical protein